MTLVAPWGRRRSGLFSSRRTVRRRGWFAGVDKLLWFLRFAASRSLAHDWVLQGHIRQNFFRNNDCGGVAKRIRR